MALDLFTVFFAAVRGVSQTQLLLLVGAMFSRLNLWTEQGRQDVGKIVAKVMLPVFVFMEFAKPASRDKLKAAFASSEGNILVGLTLAQMMICLFGGFVMVKVLSFSKGVQRCGNLISLSLAFGNATAMPVLLIKAIEHLFSKDDRDFLMPCVLVYGTINRGLMWTLGPAICCGKVKLSFLLNEINVASVLGLLVAFSQDLIGIDLMALLHSKNNWMDFAGTAQNIGAMANPMLMMTAGAALSKGPKSEDMDSLAIWASTIGRLVAGVPLCLALLHGAGINETSSGNTKAMGFIILLNSCMPAAAQLALVADRSGVKGALQNMSSLLFYHSVVCPVTCTMVLALALQMFSTAGLDVAA